MAAWRSIAPSANSELGIIKTIPENKKWCFQFLVPKTSFKYNSHMKRTVIMLAALLIIACSHAEQETMPAATVDSDEFKIETTTPSRLSVTDFSDVAAQTIDAVVHIKCDMTKVTPLYESFFGFIIDRGQRQQSYTAFGSGVIISTDGYIITNNHVVQDAERITVTLNDRRELAATLIGNDPATDLAIIKVETQGLQSIPFGNSDQVRVGEPVLAIGNPFNLTSTVTAGIISAKARNMNIINNTDGLESPIESFLQTDAAVNSGNSGGALVNGSAQLIGIITAIASGNGYYTGYSFAIPSNLAVKVANDLRKYGYVQRAYLGVNVADLPEGVRIEQALPNCAVANAGLREGDIIRSINGTTIKSFSEMMEEVGRFNPGDRVEVAYERNGKRHTASVVLLNSKGTTEVLTRQQIEAERKAQQEAQQRQLQEQLQQQRQRQRYYIPW